MELWNRCFDIRQQRYRRTETSRIRDQDNWHQWDLNGRRDINIDTTCLFELVPYFHKLFQKLAQDQEAVSELVWQLTAENKTQFTGLWFEDQKNFMIISCWLNVFRTHGVSWFTRSMFHQLADIFVWISEDMREIKQEVNRHLCTEEKKISVEPPTSGNGDNMPAPEVVADGIEFQEKKSPVPESQCQDCPCTKRQKMQGEMTERENVEVKDGKHENDEGEEKRERSGKMETDKVKGVAIIPKVPRGQKRSRGRPHVVRMSSDG